MRKYLYIYNNSYIYKYTKINKYFIRYFHQSTNNKYKMPLDTNLFKTDEGCALVKQSQERRYKDVKIVDEVKEIVLSLGSTMHESDNAKKKKRELSKQFGALKKAKKLEELNQLKEDISNIKSVESKLDEEANELKNQLKEKMNTIGNLVHDSVVVSNDEENNGIVATHGEPRKPKDGEELINHHELLYMIDGYAPEPGSVVAGHRGYFLKGVGVLLNQALINYGLTFLMKKGYIPLQPPYMMNKDIMAETAQLEQFDEELYKVVSSDNPNDDKYLIATSEQPISAFHRKKWLTDNELPIRYAGISTCFRKEAGAYGKDAWGIFRVHQFEKIEQFCITNPEKSWEMHNDMSKVAEEFYQSLGLSYRVVNIVSGELNNAAAKKLDLEAWFPTLGVYRELVSCSNCTDYQARSMDTRYRQDNEKNKFVHMLNGTLCATERTICCLLENYQSENGVIVPEVLRPFMGGMEIMPYVNEKPAAKKAKKKKN